MLSLVCYFLNFSKRITTRPIESTQNNANEFHSTISYFVAVVVIVVTVILSSLEYEKAIEIAA